MSGAGTAASESVRRALAALLALAAGAGLAAAARGAPAGFEIYGYGAGTTGCGNSPEYAVTSLADSGRGTLRDAVANGRSNLCVVMKVPGTIELESNLYYSGSNLTFDGSRAAVQITGRPFVSSGNNIIHRYMRYRHGGPALGDSTGVRNGEGIVYDHCSIQYGADQSMYLSAVTDGQRISRVTIQNSIVGPTLGCPDPGSGRCNEHGTRSTHAVGALFGGDATDVTFYRNLTGWGDSRFPQYGAGQRAKSVPDTIRAARVGRLEIVQNWIHGVKYASHFWASKQWELQVDVIDNVLTVSDRQREPFNRFPYRIQADVDPTNPAPQRIYMRGNLFPGESAPRLPALQCQMASRDGRRTLCSTPELRSATRFAPHPYPPGDWRDVRATLRDGVGASLPYRDALDEKLVAEADAGSGWWIEGDLRAAGGLPDLERCRSRSCGYVNVRPSALDVLVSGRPDRAIEWTPRVDDPDDAPLQPVCHVLRQVPNAAADVAPDCSRGRFQARAEGRYVVPYEVGDGRDRASASLVVTVTRR